MSRPLTFPAVLAAVLLLAAIALGEAPHLILGSYAAPVAETVEFVANWLGQAGFAITREIPEAGNAGLLAKKPGQNLRVEIAPKSPLVSVVTIYGSTEGPTMDDLRAGLENQLQPGKRQPGGARLDLPVEVRSREDAVLCLKTSVKGESFTFSGFAIDNRGYLITTAHNLEGAGSILGTDNRGDTLTGEMLKRDPVRDLTLVKFDRGLGKTVPLAEGRQQLQEGDRVYAIGCPGNAGRRVLTGVVDRPPAMVDGQPLWQVAMEIAPGASGGAAFDREGRLVGVIKGRYRGADSRGFLIPLDTLLQFLESLADEPDTPLERH